MNSINTNSELAASAEHVGQCFIRLRLNNNGRKPAVSEKSLSIANAMLASIDDDYHNKKGFLGNTPSYFKKHGYYKGFTTARSRIKLFTDNKEGFNDIMDDFVVTKKKGSRKGYMELLAGEVIDSTDFNAINDYFEGKEVSLTAEQTTAANLIAVRLVDETIGHALHKFDKVERLAKYMDRFDR